MQYRQGDVLVVRDDEAKIEGEKQARARGRLVIAEGEVTGHAHAIDAGGAVLYGDDPTMRILDVIDTVDLVHDEHATITLPPGRYRVIQQREYRPRGWQLVAD